MSCHIVYTFNTQFHTVNVYFIFGMYIENFNKDLRKFVTSKKKRRKRSEKRLNRSNSKIFNKLNDFQWIHPTGPIDHNQIYNGYFVHETEYLNKDDLVKEKQKRKNKNAIFNFC